MNKSVSSQILQTATLNTTVAPSGILQRKCAACGTHTVVGDKCNECQKGALQRKSSSNSERSEVPPIVHDVLNSSGQPLDKSTKVFFESRFAHNFSGIPFTAASPQLSQSSLKIGAPTDIYEQEADRIADSVMLKTGNENKNLSASAAKVGKFDLSRIRVHTDARAAESARSINAQAYTFGNNIVFGAGEFAPKTHSGQHLLAHELAHVAQQTGSGATRGVTNKQSLISQSVQRNFIQRKKVPTNFGEFETTKFDESESRGVEIILKFHPDTAKVDAKKIALSQSVKTINAAGDTYAIDPSTSARMVGSGKAGAGYAIDRLSDKNNPIYGGKTLGASENLKDTPLSQNTTASPINVGGNTTYQIGQPKDADKGKRAAQLYDKALGGGKKRESKMFETTALAIEGTDNGKYYGSVKWGFKMEGTDAAPTVTKMDIVEASKGNPTDNFTEAAKLFNAAKIRGKIEVIKVGGATVTKLDGTEENLAIGKKLKQLNTVMLDDLPAVQAEILNDDGTGSGKIVYIKNSDVKDAGDGSDTKDLPIPVANPPVKKTP